MESLDKYTYKFLVLVFHFIFIATIDNIYTVLSGLR